MTAPATTTRTRPDITPNTVITTSSSRRQLHDVALLSILSIGLAVAAVALGAPAGGLPFILAFGPALIALALARREVGGARRLLRTLVVRPPRARWYLVLAVPVAWALATVGVAILLGEPTTGLFDSLFPAILVIPLVVVLPAMAEELAWRGFALPRLLPAMSPLAAALVVGVPWTLLHVALFLPGQWYAGLELWPLVVSIVSYSILLTWVFVGTGGSVLMAALFHAGLNGVAPVMAGIDPEASWVIRNVLAGGLAVTLVAMGGLGPRSRPWRRSTGPVGHLPSPAKG